MKRFERISSALLLTLGISACGGAEEAAQAPAAEAAPAVAVEAAAGSSEMTMPEWFRVDESAQTVEIDVAATMDGGWKFNGMSQGSGTITVPEGYTVTAGE